MWIRKPFRTVTMAVLYRVETEEKKKDEDGPSVTVENAPDIFIGEVTRRETRWRQEDIESSFSPENFGI